MTDGGYTLEEAAKLQTFTGRKKCRYADKYQAKQFPKCSPICGECLNKWMARVSADDAAGKPLP